MGTIHYPYRPPGYLVRQGFVKPLWLVKLRRADTKRTYVPEDEAYNLPAIKAGLESDKYSVATIDHISLELARTDELVDFLGGLKDPKKLSIKIFAYLIFRKWQKQLVWYGRLQNLPEGIDAYPWDKLKLTFNSAPGAWEDGDAVKDPDTKNWYKNKHVKDLLLPKFLKKAFQQAGPGGGCKYRLDEPKVKGEDYFWSGVELPRKKLARKSAKYDDTYQVKSLCWDSTRKVVYMGVWSSYSPKNPWLISYHPASRRWNRVCGFKYAGGTRALRLTGWEVLHLEYSAAKDKVYYVCQTTHPNLKDPQAHYKCYGEINMANPPENVSLVNARLFTLHNRGIVIRSKPVGFKNKGGTKVGDTQYWAYATTECIGWGTPRGEKEHGVLGLDGFIDDASLLEGTPIKQGQNRIFIARVVSKKKNPGIDYTVEVHDVVASRRQNFGRITHIEEHDKSFECTVEHRAQCNFPADADVYLYKTSAQPSDNVFIGKPQNLKLRFHFSKGLKSTDAETVYVEGRKARTGREEFFWPYNLGEIDETGEFYVDRVGYVSFIEFREMEMYSSDYPKEEDAKEWYSSGPVAPFEIELEGYNPSFLVEDGFFVKSSLQTYGDYGPITQPGPCRVVKDGKTCKVGNDELKTYGDIFLFKDGGGIWVAWNDHRLCDKTDEYFSQCRIAKWNTRTKKFDNVFVDRHNTVKGKRWWNEPECYITSFARYRNRCYGGRRYYDPNWVPTNLRIFWAAPPQNEYGEIAKKKVTKYGGVAVAIAMVTGDRTDLFEPGTIIRLGDKFNEPTGKRYYVSEVQTFSREIKPYGSCLASAWRDITDTREGSFLGQLTLLSLLGVDADGVLKRGYEGQVWLELHNKYVNFMRGRTERHQIWRLCGEKGWEVAYAARPHAGEPKEGGEVDYNAKQWRGESHAVEYEDDYARMPRVALKEKNVVAGSLAVTLKDSSQKLELTDYTEDTEESKFYETWPIPEKYKCYVHRKKGEDYDECYLYFNPGLEDEEIDVAYEYYLPDAEIKCPVVFNGQLYFNEAGPRHRFVKKSGGTFVSAYSPRAGDRELACVAPGDDRIWAISAPSNLLVQFGKEWSGYVHEVDAGGKKIWQIVADLARACDKYCFDHLGTLYVVRRNTPTKTGTFPNVLKITRKDLPPYERVTFGYANGKVELGSGKPALSLSCKYVYDKGHAEILCAAAYAFYTIKRRLFTVECAGIIEQFGLCEEKEFYYQGNKVSGIVTGRQFSPKGTTTFTVVEKVVAAYD